MWGRTPLEGAPHQYLYHVRYIVSQLMAGAAPPSVAPEGTAGRGRVGGVKGGRGKAEGGAWGEGGGKTQESWRGAQPQGAANVVLVEEVEENAKKRDSSFFSPFFSPFLQ